MSRSPSNPSSTVSSCRRTDVPAEPTEAVLHVVFPLALKRSHALSGEPVTLGRDPGLRDLFLEHGTISRRHATVQWNGAEGTHTVCDLGSRNGTWVDGIKATDVARPLIDGSVVRMGDTLLIYEQNAASGDAPQVSSEAIPGIAANMRRLRTLIAKAARDPAAALIVGETGAGKERVARELHRLSGRPGKLLAFNVAALSAQLLESQLFGHVKGAFTGAHESQVGLFRAAHQGTLFLDEIGDLAPDLQAKLLRVLQEKEVLPVGATQPVPIDVRVVAATHRDLARAIATGGFREDLYGRLCTWEIRVPPLRERRVDLLPWIERLHAPWAAARNTQASLKFDADAAEQILRATWPLNLRGVERLVHELGVRDAPQDLIARSKLPSWLASGVVSTVPVGREGNQEPTVPTVPTRDEFVLAFEQVQGSVHALAKRFDRDRRQIYRWIEAHGLSDRRTKKDGPS